MPGNQRRIARAALTFEGGYWQRPANTMSFCGEPTADGDQSATYLREWYEANRETWWERFCRPMLYSEIADNFMLSLLLEVQRIDGVRQAQTSAAAKTD